MNKILLNVVKLNFTKLNLVGIPMKKKSSGGEKNVSNFLWDDGSNMLWDNGGQILINEK